MSDLTKTDLPQVTASRRPGMDPALRDDLLEQMLAPENLRKAWRQGKKPIPGCRVWTGGPVRTSRPLRGSPGHALAKRYETRRLSRPRSGAWRFPSGTDRASGGSGFPRSWSG